MRDWGKHIIILLIGVIAILLFMVRTLRNHQNDMDEQVAKINVQNDSLKRDIKGRDLLIKDKDKRIQSLLDSLRISEKDVLVLDGQYTHLKTIYGHLADSLRNVPVDTSYRFLVDEAYPYPGQKKYPFNKPQVKGIQLTYLEKISLKKMNVNLITQIDKKDYQLRTKDTIVYEQGKKIDLMTSTRKDLEKTINNKDGVIKIKDKQIKKVKRRKTFWQITGGVIIVFLAILSSGGG